MMSFDFTVITATLNSADTVERCLSSVAGQNDVRVQHIIQDGGSNDQTKQLVSKYLDAEFHCQKDGGIYDAMNLGSQRAQGDYILFLNSDDYLFEDQVLKKAHEVLTKLNSQYVLGYGDIIQEAHDRVHLVTAGLEKSHLGWKFQQIAHPAMIASRKLVKRYSFNSELMISADFEFQLKCMTDPEVRLCRLDFPISVFSIGGTSTRSLNAQLQGLRECIAVNRRLFGHTNLPAIVSKVIKKRISAKKLGPKPI